jgi:phosphoribosylformylglycinamidine (FGAM) synthase PurS component
MATRIEIGLKRGVRDPRAQGVVSRARHFLHLPLRSCATRDVLKIDTALKPGEIRRLRAALTDPVTSRSTAGRLPPPPFDWLVEVGFKPGVTDNVGRTARTVVQDVLGRALGDYEEVYTSTQYFLRGTLDRAGAEQLGRQPAGQSR